MKITKKTVLLLTIPLLIAALGYFWLTFSPAPEPPPIEGLVWPQAKPVPPFQLIDQNRQSFNLQRLQGKWTLLFFGYTQCPDICPITLTLLQGVKHQLETYPDINKDTQYVFVSVDPARDDAEKLKGYVEYFDPSFLGVTGSALEISELTRQLGVIYIKVQPPGADDTQYLIDHSSAIFLVNPQAHMVGVFSAPHETPALVQHYLQMRNFLQSPPAR